MCTLGRGGEGGTSCENGPKFVPFMAGNNIDLPFQWRAPLRTGVHTARSHCLESSSNISQCQYLWICAPSFGMDSIGICGSKQECYVLMESSQRKLHGLLLSRLPPVLSGDRTHRACWRILEPHLVFNPLCRSAWTRHLHAVQLDQ